MATDFLPPALDDAEWRRRAESVLVAGASTGSKRTAALYGASTADLPTHFTSASGCRLTTAGGVELIDCTMALGAVALGYADENVTAAVGDAVNQGNVTGLSHQLEVEVAERLCGVIPCAEQVQFLKTGAEGVAAAVRIARTYTKRSRVLYCGYHGWLDWCSSAAGVPEGVRGDARAIPYDDIDALHAAIAESGGALAAIVLEPFIERLPDVKWLQAAREAATAAGAVLIFDEVKTGFRIKTGGMQEDLNIVPDLAVLGKALANGFPLSAVVGLEEVMQSAADTWISSTLAGEATALAAASAVLDWHATADVCGTLRDIGEEMMGGVRRAIDASRITGVTLRGIPPMWWLDFGGDNEAHDLFIAQAVSHGVLFKRGAYNFPSLAHQADEVSSIERAASEALVFVRDTRGH